MRRWLLGVKLSILIPLSSGVLILASEAGQMGHRVHCSSWTFVLHWGAGCENRTEGLFLFLNWALRSQELKCREIAT